MPGEAPRGPLSWSIGQLAQQAGVSVDTVRHYEQSGLLLPDHRRLSGVRRYGPSALNRLRFISRARALGLSLDKIADILNLGSAEAPSRSKRLALHLSDLEARIAALTRLRQALLVVNSQPGKGEDVATLIVDTLNDTPD
jgi:DNA-binding transcriptional MerR regulator